MYSVADFGSMIADEVRMTAYVEALKRHVTPESVVLDIGTGTGIFAMLACRFGARKVYAIEPNEAIQVARELAAANGLSGRIEFFEALSTRVTLPEKADVIVSDLRGILPLHDHNLTALIDARRRLLADGGVLIPQRDELWAAPVCAPELYDPRVKPWEPHSFGFDNAAARRIVVNGWRKGRVAPEQLLAPAQRWAVLDYTKLETASASGQPAWMIDHAGTAHGLCVWFDTVLADGVGFSNAPGGGAKVYGSGFFPFRDPIDLAPDDRVAVQIRADLVGDDYVWSWKTRVEGRGADGPIKAEFQQSTFLGTALSPLQLRKRADHFVPRLNEDGEIDEFILGLMRGDLTQREIARRVSERYPRLFKDWQAALVRVSALSGKYCE